ncbi:MAG: FecR domain-containing protein [Sandaracinus sp.]
MTEKPRNAEALAALLRGQDTASADDLARLERGVVAQVRAGRAPAGSTGRPWIGIGVGLAAAAALALWMTRAEEPPPVARHDATPAPVSEVPALASLHTGSELASGEAMLGHAQLGVIEGSLVHVDDDAISHAAVTLARGEVHVAFHPVHRGEEHLAIVTDVARIEVVGTEFVVTRGETSTRVVVTEGVVRVTELRTGEAHDVRPGESIEVPFGVAPDATAPARTEAPAPSEHRPSVPSLAVARAAAEAGDTSLLEDVAAHGSRSDRIAALEDLEEGYGTHDPEGRRRALEALMALDPHGEHGLTALYLHARSFAGEGEASELARYLAELPEGSFAAQARQRACALDESRCAVP